MSHNVVIPERVLPPTVGEFCTAHRLRRHVLQAMALAEECFQPAALGAEVEVDPETDEQVLVITAQVALHEDEVVRRKREYTRRWVASAAPDAREKIRLLYDIV